MLLPSAMAEITINDLNSVYNLGDKIIVASSVSLEQDFQGFFKLTLYCDDFNLPYFITPISLEAQQETEMTVPELTTFGSMEGNCKINAEILSNSMETFESLSSGDFEITKELELAVDDDSMSAMPGDEITIKGTVKKKDGSIIEDTTMKVNFDDNDHTTTVENGDFEYNVSLDEFVKYGKHDVLLYLEDSYGNVAEKYVEIIIVPVLKKLENNINKKIFDPEEKLEFTISLVDQAGDLVESSVEFVLTAPNREKILDETAETNEPIIYRFGQQALPGEYKIKISVEDLLDEDIIELNAVEKIDISLDGEIVIVKNIGNVKYEDKTTIILESEGKKYMIDKKLKLDPGESTTIDLSREVPYGSYSVTLPAEGTAEEDSSAETEEEMANDELTKDESTLVMESSNEPVVVVEDVIIEDNRPVHKKTIDGITTITGNVVGAGSKLTSKPFWAVIILIIVVLLVIAYYKRDYIKQKFSKKSEDDVVVPEFKEK